MMDPSSIRCLWRGGCRAQLCARCLMLELFTFGTSAAISGVRREITYVTMNIVWLLRN